MWIFHRTHGPAFASSVARSMCLSGFIPMLYATVVCLAFVPLGILWGSVLAYALAIPTTYAVSGSLKWVQRRDAARREREAGVALEPAAPALTR